MFIIFEQLVYLLTNVIPMILLILFTESVYNEKYQAKTVIWAAFICGLIMYGLMYPINLLHLNLLSFIVAIPIMMLLFKKFFGLHYLKGIVAVSTFYILGAIGNIIAFWIVDSWGLNISGEFRNYLLLNLIMYPFIILALVIIRYFKIFLILPHEIKRKAYLSNIINLLFSLFIIAANLYYYLPGSNISHKTTGMLLTAILILGYFIYSILGANSLWKLELKKHELENQIFYNQTLEVLMRDLVRFKHDYNNHLNVMNCYIQMQKWDELTHYFKELVGQTQSSIKFDHRLIDKIKNAGILGLITSKIDYSQKSGVTMQLEIPGEIKEINMKISELCEVLGIFLDNAIEAAARSAEQSVKVRISNVNNQIAFYIENSVDHQVDPKQIFEWGYSTKEGSHGAGLWIVRKILNKYKNITLNTIAGERNLIQELIITQSPNKES
ncbi:MAG: GHKL domain-containing protein [Firmicutes bacterium]|nr:GHKL domain-containing protein [Bacillota bacterium]